MLASLSSQTLVLDPDANMTSRIIIHAVRHAQGYHNIAEDFELKDPCLTPLGRVQSIERRKASFPDQSKFKLVASSPLIRALHTAYLVFHPTIQKQAILAIPEAQEVTDYHCDTGSDLDVLQAAAAENEWPVDFSLVSHGWFDKSIHGPNSPVSHASDARARKVRKILREKGKALRQDTDDDIHIALVAHGSFMHYFSNDWEKSAVRSGTGWVNCETRRYVFQNDNDDEAWLVETEESREARGLRGPAPSMEEQKQLYEVAMLDWIEQGLPDLRHVETASALPQGKQGRCML
ncbi:hypothetical protein F66182_5502 [Fusarium sp. NRRL 66182]|nr:hypothetical protein F66182_5502 [Fusarium sp. NRRL 66182]